MSLCPDRYDFDPKDSRDGARTYFLEEGDGGIFERLEPLVLSPLFEKI